MHGIRIGEALAGVSADAVAAQTDGFAAFDVVSDNSLWEQHWLDRLREGRRRIEVQALRQAMLARMQPHEADWFRCALLRGRPAHRAAADAERIARAWLAAIRGDLLAA